MAVKKKDWNKECAKCAKKCKMSNKVILQYCPNFERIDKK